MSSFPAQFVDMTIERGLFDHTGAQPPVTKLLIELPPEYVDKPEPGATPPYSDGGIDQQVLADIQTAVMREYGGVARRYLNAFRQDVSLGSNAINGRRAMLGEGVGMNYVSQFGNEAIRIHVSQEGVRRLIGEDDRYMLVLYWNGSINIAAIPMRNIDNPFGHVVYNKVSTSGLPFYQWGYECRGSSQFKISSDLHVLASSVIYGSDGSMSIDPDKKFYYCNTRDSLFGGVVAPLFARSSSANTTGSPSGILMNWNGRVVYDGFGNKVDFSNKPPVATSKSPWVYSRKVYSVGTNGELWGQATAYWGLQILAATKDFTPQPISNMSIWNDSHISVYGPGENDETLYGRNFNAELLGQTRSVNQHFLSYSNNGSVDKLTDATTPLTMSGSFDGVAAYDVTISLLGYTGHFYETYSPQVPHADGNLGLKTYPMYMYGTTKNDIFVTWTYNYNQALSHVDGPTMMSPFGGWSGWEPIQNPVQWGFVANGKKVINQWEFASGGFQWMSIYNGRIDYGTTLNNALGISNEWFIFQIVLDVKLSDIKKLK